MVQGGNTGSNMDENVELKRKCLALIIRIAARGAASLDPDDVNTSLEGLKWALNQYLDHDLPQLHLELRTFTPTADALTAFDMVGFAMRSTWN
jgi:hypothetical protein